jgi:hypothetical protein
MIDLLPLEDIRDASNEAFAKIDYNPDRLRELSDADLNAIAMHVKATRAILEAELVCICGDAGKANEAVERVMAFSQGKLIKLVRAAQHAMKTHRNPSHGQVAALLIDARAGCGAVIVEQERRAALKAGAMN